MSAPREYVFFTDRDLGKQFPEILRNALIHVERHGDHFADDAKDEDWLKEVSQHGWYVLTHDQRMRYRPNEIAAIEKFKIGLFVIVGKAPMAELAQNFVFTFRQIIKFIEENPRPFIAKIYRPDQAKRESHVQPSGYVKLWVAF
jgi:hypothetical protein